YPDLPVVLTRCGYRADRYLFPLWEAHRNLYVETSGYVVHAALARVAGRFGPERLLFGTGLPDVAPGAAVLFLVRSGLSPAGGRRGGGGTLGALREGGRGGGGRGPPPRRGPAPEPRGRAERLLPGGPRGPRGPRAPPGSPRGRPRPGRGCRSPRGTPGGRPPACCATPCCTAGGPQDCRSSTPTPTSAGGPTSPSPAAATTTSCARWTRRGSTSPGSPPCWAAPRITGPATG